MARQVLLLRPGLITEVRSEVAVIAAENASLVDANFPTAKGFCSRGFDSVLLCPEIVGGTAPTMTLEVLIRDADAADGLRWKRIAGAKHLGGDDAASQALGPLDGTKFVELFTYGAELVIVRVTAVTNAALTTAWKILAMPGATSGVLR